MGGRGEHRAAGVAGYASFRRAAAHGVKLSRYAATSVDVLHDPIACAAQGLP